MKKKIVVKIITSYAWCAFKVGNLFILMALVFFIAPYYFDAILEAMQDPAFADSKIMLSYAPIVTLSLALFWIGYLAWKVIWRQVNKTFLPQNPALSNREGSEK